MLHAVLLHPRLQQSQWCSILFKLVFALNTTISKATKCVPYEAVFGCPAVLPQEILLVNALDGFEHGSASIHQHTVSSSSNDIFDKVKKAMQRHYNKNIRFNSY